MIEINVEIPKREIIENTITINARPIIAEVHATVDNNVGIPYVEVTQTGTEQEFAFNLDFHNLKGEQGIQGERGLPGNGIESIEKTSTLGLVDTYTITYSDSNTDTFEVTNGQDGVSPTASIEQTDTGATITVTDGSGTTTADILNGVNGTDGTDGQSAEITGATASVTNTVGTPSVTVTAGGTSLARSFDFAFDNLKGETGADGEDGFSPIATVTKTGTVATITITDKNGTTTANVYDGTGGGGDITDVLVDNVSVVSSGIAYIDLTKKQNLLTAGENIKFTPILDYIQNAASTKVNTGIEITQDDFELDITFYCNSTTSLYLFQIRDDSSSKITGIAGSGTGGTITLNCDTKTLVSDIARTVGHIYHVNGRFDNGSMTLKVDDLTAGTTDTKTSTYTYAQTTTPLYIFGNNSTQTLAAGYRVYNAYCKINGQYVLNYIPTMNNSTPCFYDTVSKTYIGASAGTLTGGSDTGFSIIGAYNIPTDTSDLTNGAGFITSSALSGYATETWVGQQGYITGINSTDVTTALGYTPYNSSNPSGYIDSSALTPYQLIAQSINVLSTSGTITLTDNSINTITPTGNVTFTLPSVTDNTVLHQIFVQVNLSTVYSFDLGLGVTPHYFNKKAPDLSNAGVYNLYFEYDKANQYWVGGDLPKGAST